MDLLVMYIIHPAVFKKIADLVDIKKQLYYAELACAEFPGLPSGPLYIQRHTAAWLNVSRQPSGHRTAVPTQDTTQLSPARSWSTVPSILTPILTLTL